MTGRKYRYLKEIDEKTLNLRVHHMNPLSNAPYSVAPYSIPIFRAVCWHSGHITNQLLPVLLLTPYSTRILFLGAKLNFRGCNTAKEIRCVDGNYISAPHGAQCCSQSAHRNVGSDTRKWPMFRLREVGI